MRFAVTGATGFVGAALCEVLVAEGISVTAFQRPSSDASDLQRIGAKVESISGSDEGLRASLERVRPNIIVHLATHYSRTDDQITSMVGANIELGTRMLAASVNLDPLPRFLFSGTFFQYFQSGEDLNLYAATKSAFRTIVEYYGKAYGVCHGEVVLSDIYGPGSRRTKLIEAAVRAAESGGLLNVPEEDVLLQLLHVSDAATAIRCAASALLDSDAPCGSRWFAAPEQGVRLTEVLEQVETVLNMQVHRRARESDPQSRVMNSLVKGPPPPGWSPKVSLESGIAGLVQL